MTTANRVRLCLHSVWVAALVCPGAAAAQSDLERARMLYNSGRFDEAIAAATTAASKPAAIPSATLIVARSRLERFRALGDPKELAVARAELVSLNPRTLAPQEAIEWQIGVGTALFLENQMGPAAEMFTSVLPVARGRLSASEFEKVLEWWGDALARLAEGLTGDGEKAGLREVSHRRAARDRSQSSFPGRRVLDRRRSARIRRPRRGVECCGRRMDSVRGGAGRGAAADRSRPLRRADAHPRTGASADRTAPRRKNHRL